MMHLFGVENRDTLTHNATGVEDAQGHEAPIQGVVDSIARPSCIQYND
ncbi:hypothetical protein RchiOBHm_Chr2g0112931 [Rosa chinensis]|uniref:Uncharacterized protein n=1 Tax=Rosa chinensis TaxID=74649 RepID=A0A2P6RQD2_ROSCH|nr:hypothetical protein RchiOBHm_Chr2g0112931 [Rosa chinensis]